MSQTGVLILYCVHTRPKHVYSDHEGNMFHRVKCSHYAVHRANHDPNMFILTVIGTTSWGSFDLA